MKANKQQIIDLETRFWQAIKDKDVAAGQAMVADQALVTGPMGTMRLDPAKFGQQMREASWTLNEFEFRDIDVLFPTDDVAVIAYKVHQTEDWESGSREMDAADSTVWVRDGESWKCALHTESYLEAARQPEPA